ncbi:MAG: hypothetical protein AAF654_00040 [Myxococcota bacterium]
METVFADFMSGNITVATAILSFVLAAAVSGVAGALGGIAVGGSKLGNDVSSLLGSFFGPPVAIPALAAGMAIVLVLGGA